MLGWKAFLFNEFQIVICRRSTSFEIYYPFKGNNPRPFFFNIGCTEIESGISSTHFKRGRYHLLGLGNVALVGLESSNIQNICDFFASIIGKANKVVGCEDYPSFPPFFKELWTLKEASFSNFTIFQILSYFILGNHCFIDINYMNSYLHSIPKLTHKLGFLCTKFN